MWYSETTTTNGYDSLENKRLRQEIKRLDARIDWLNGKRRDQMLNVHILLAVLLIFDIALILQLILKGI